MRRELLSVIFIIISHTVQAATYKVDGDLVGEITHYNVGPDDTLYSIARKFDLGIVEVLAANPGVDVWLPEEGRELVLPTAHIIPSVPHEGIVINLSELRLYYFPDDTTVMTFPIGIGMEGWQTPVGTTKIILKRENPTWIPPASLRKENPKLPELIPPGPDNPLGAYALNLGWEGYRIHGTNRPQGIGKRSSHGCIRLYPEDIRVLFAAITVGTPVTVIDQPVKFGWLYDVLYLQVTPAQGQLDDIAAYQIPQPTSIHGIHKEAREAIAGKGMEIDWYAVDSVLLEHSGIPVDILKHDTQ